jgi:DNA-binding transcriptional regulator YhcF (GntR family)
VTRAEQIADGLRQRIRQGRLRPGDPVPSTRAIMRDHNVAMATASRVLALLQAEGLIESTPGRGSVVRTPERAPVDTVNTERLVAAAITVADAETLAAVSMRRLAGVLGIPTMAVYRYVASRELLEIAMLDRVLGELRLPSPSGVWRTDLFIAARAMWALMTAHPWLAGALSMTRPAVLPNAMPLSEWLITVLRGTGLDPIPAFTEYLCLLNLVRGLGMNIEPEATARAETGMTSDEWMDTRVDELRRAAPDDRFPAMAEVMRTDYPFDLDVLLDTALTRYLDGLAVRVASLRS